MKDLFNKLPDVKIKTALILFVTSLIFLAIATSLKPQKHYSSGFDNFENSIPKEFGDWKEAPQLTPQVSLVSDNKSLQNQIYDDVIMRTYVNKDGAKIMLALAYVKEQRQDVKVHQPEICYPAQGFQMLSSKVSVFNMPVSSSPVVGKRQVYSGSSHQEAVSYWIRVADETLLTGIQMRLKIIEDGLFKGRLDDGVLVRVSSITNNESDVSKFYQLHDQFLRELTATVEGKFPGLLVPSASKT
ncbi:exosortase C-terminal domain/associated protein EpsI [Methylophilus sp. Leaf414]|uniref:exosortase C-terminal domain/associated protein EpsI n=1 Tax=Methylophilus sp. Leaf414 TaxID=1736371 RepID=UPI0006F79EAE|nr:exosortase C-terminal domain/associated protein EpsI [Methylophilus sp. Leaf414]KQT34468.1 hypothetical protein ASG24_12210 [Methylophilus sp. Leaf414]